MIYHNQIVMGTFAERLRAGIERTGLTQKEFAVKAGINKRALDMYLGKQESMPPADVAVKIADALGVSVEYLVTGQERENQGQQNTAYSSVIADLEAMPEDVMESVIKMIRTVARKKD